MYARLGYNGENRFAENFMSFIPGGNVGPYQVIEQLGQGGMASVYKAYHAALDRYVALKVLHLAFNEDSTFIGRFQREARVVAKLEHPNIVPVYDYAEHEGRPYLVMKFIEGDTLKARLGAGPLSAKEIEQVVETVGSALGYAHRQGVLHRDVKPSNVLISIENVMYLADFGLARIAQSGESTLSADSIMGTPQYISPEQAMGKKDLDAKTDIYSFGVMLYELVVGQVPFNADTPFSIIHDHIYTPLPLPQAVNSNVPEPVQRVLLKSLAKNRDDRFNTVEELIGAFKSAWLEAGIPMRGSDISVVTPAVSAGKPTRGVEKARVENPLKRQKQTRFSWMWAGVGLVAFLCLCFGFLALRNTATETANAPVPTLEADSPIGQVSPPAPGGPNPLRPVPGATPTMIPEDQMSPEIRQAYDRVTANPGDPYAHLDLSLAFWDAGMEPSAFDEYIHAADTAGPDNVDFFVSAADSYRAHEAWHLASGMYLRAMPLLTRGGGFIPEEVKGGFREAAYKGAERRDMPMVAPFDQMTVVQSQFANIIRGRNALFIGDMGMAEESLAQAMPAADALPEVYLLQAEIAIQKGNLPEAREILSALAGKPNVSPWMLVMAEGILKLIQ
jgi:serine/threonine protein kinase